MKNILVAHRATDCAQSRGCSPPSHVHNGFPKDVVDQLHWFDTVRIYSQKMLSVLSFGNVLCTPFVGGKTLAQSVRTTPQTMFFVVDPATKDCEAHGPDELTIRKTRWHVANETSNVTVESHADWHRQLIEQERVAHETQDERRKRHKRLRSQLLDAISRVDADDILSAAKTLSEFKETNPKTVLLDGNLRDTKRIKLEPYVPVELDHRLVVWWPPSKAEPAFPELPSFAFTAHAASRIFVTCSGPSTTMCFVLTSEDHVTRVADLGRTEFALATCGDQPVVFGGVKFGPDLKTPKQWCRAFVDDSEIWESCSPPRELVGRPRNVRKLSATEVGGRSLCYGGLGVDGYSTAEVWQSSKIDLTSAWHSNPAEIGASRFGHTASRIGARIVVVGGSGTRGRQPRRLAVSSQFDLLTREWSRLPAQPQELRYDHAAAVLPCQQWIVVAGGRNEAKKVLASVELFANDKWFSLPPMTTPRFAFGLVVLGSWIHAIHETVEALNIEDLVKAYNSNDFSKLEWQPSMLLLPGVLPTSRVQAVAF